MNINSFAQNSDISKENEKEKKNSFEEKEKIIDLESQEKFLSFIEESMKSYVSSIFPSEYQFSEKESLVKFTEKSFFQKRTREIHSNFFSITNSVCDDSEYEKSSVNENKLDDFKQKLNQWSNSELEDNNAFFELKVKKIKKRQTKKVFKIEKKKKFKKTPIITTFSNLPENSFKNLESLSNLLKVLKNIFICKEIKLEDFSLNQLELNILNFIIQRKFGKKLRKVDIENSSNEENLKRITKILRTRSYKRPEECYKFIFTKTIKFLKSNHQKNSKEDFYDFYFKDISDEVNIPMFEFHYPFHKSAKGSSLNAAYFQKVFLSSNFKNDFLKYCKEKFLSEYDKELDNKLQVLLSKWIPPLQSSTKNITIEDIKKYFLKNTKSKLPWSFKEIKLALLRMESMTLIKN